MRLTAYFSSACAFANGRWAEANGGPRDTPRARLSFQTRQRAGQSEREKLRRVNPRSGGPEQSGRRSRALEPSGTLKRRRRRARTGASAQYARDRTRCRGTEPHESGGGSQGSSQSFGENSAGAPKPKKDGHGVSSMSQRRIGTPQSGSLNFSAKPHSGIVQAMRRYGPTPTLKGRRTPGEEGASAVMPAGQLERIRPRSDSGTAPKGDKL
jgi:hypothetical protein